MNYDRLFGFAEFFVQIWRKNETQLLHFFRCDADVPPLNGFIGNILMHVLRAEQNEIAGH